MPTTLFLMSHHEQIRPRVADMRDMDGDQPWVDWPPAARAVRTKPPAVSRPGETPREEAAAPRPIMGASATRPVAIRIPRLQVNVSRRFADRAWSVQQRLTRLR